jgi:hypothetical protein
MTPRDAGRARLRYRLFLGMILVAVVSLGRAWTAPAAPVPAGIAGNWLGTWKSGESPAKGPFSAALSTKPAWWGDVEIVGTLEFGGVACGGVLRVSGSYYRGHEYLLTAKRSDGTIRMTSGVTVTNGPRRSLSGHYELVPGGSGCGSDSGRLDAAAR